MQVILVHQISIEFLAGSCSTKKLGFNEGLTGFFKGQAYSECILQVCSGTDRPVVGHQSGFPPFDRVSRRYSPRFVRDRNPENGPRSLRLTHCSAALCAALPILQSRRLLLHDGLDTFRG